MVGNPLAGAQEFFCVAVAMFCDELAMPVLICKSFASSLHGKSCWYEMESEVSRHQATSKEVM
jgi:hypothetical protein